MIDSYQLLDNIGAFGDFHNITNNHLDQLEVYPTPILPPCCPFRYASQSVHEDKELELEGMSFMLDRLVMSNVETLDAHLELVGLTPAKYDLNAIGHLHIFLQFLLVTLTM